MWEIRPNQQEREQIDPVCTELSVIKQLGHNLIFFAWCILSSYTQISVEIAHIFTSREEHSPVDPNRIIHIQLVYCFHSFC